MRDYEKLLIGKTLINRDIHGFFNLSDIHAAAGSPAIATPAIYMQSQEVQMLLASFHEAGYKYMLSVDELIEGCFYASRELAFLYARFISPVFYVKTVRAFDIMILGDATDMAKDRYFGGRKTGLPRTSAQQKRAEDMSGMAVALADIQARLGKLEQVAPPANHQPRKASSAFWQVFNTINAGDDQPFNHANSPDDEIAVSLQEVIQHCHDHNIDLPAPKEMIRQLKRERYFMGYIVVRSRHKKASIRCYVFKRA